MARKLVSVLIAAIMFFACNSVFAEDCSFVFTINSKTAKICGKGYRLDVAPLSIDGKTYLPFRFVAERLGAEVSWDAQRYVARAQGPDFDVKVMVGKQGQGQIINKSKSGSPVSTSSLIVGGRTMVPSADIGQPFSVPFQDQGKVTQGNIDSERIKYFWYDFTLPVDRSQTGEMLNFKKVMDDPKTKAVVVEFWFTSCTHCKYQLEHMEKLYQRYKDSGLVVLSITTDGPGNEGPRWGVLDELGITFPTLLDEKAEVYSKWISAEFPNFTLLAPAQKYALMRNEKLSDEANQKLEKMVKKLCGVD